MCVLVVAFVVGVRPGRAESASPLMLGSSWYPEQWPEANWEKDLALMQGAGLRMVRIGEFAWSSMEPTEGHYTFDWLERAIAAAAQHHLVVVLGTPTDAPPAWLTEKYPETLRIDESGQRMSHGWRRQFSYTSAKYRELCREIVEQMVRRFGHNPNVIGWQVGNEFTEDSFDAEAQRLFHDWLKAKYGTLDALNQHWNTAYSSQTYTEWDQVPMHTTRGNPSLYVDYKRFVTDQWRSFQRNQIEVIRRFALPQQFTMTNLGGLGWANRFNRNEFAADLDLVSWDAYVGQGHLEPYRMGATHDLVRGWKQKNFWVIEMQPAFVDWAPISNALDRGETRALAWEAVGHGADCVAFWQWRAGLSGEEQYHGALVGPDGEPLPFYEEARQIGAEFGKAAETLAGTSPESQVAILHDYDSRWAIDFHKQSQRYEQVDILIDYYRALRDLTQAVDIVDPGVALDKYKLVVAPSLNVISPALAEHLRAYVERGGHLVLGPRSGMKDAFNALNIQRQPGPLVPVLGAKVEQYYALLDDVPVSGQWGSGHAIIWAEYLSAIRPGTEVVMRYGTSNGWLDGQPAAVSRRVGQGTLLYVGALFDGALMRSAAAAWVSGAQLMNHVIPVPAKVEVCRRVGAGREIYIFINHDAAEVRFDLPSDMTDLLGGGIQRHVELPRHGVAVLVRSIAISR